MHLQTPHESVWAQQLHTFDRLAPLGSKMYAASASCCGFLEIPACATGAPQAGISPKQVIN